MNRFIDSCDNLPDLTNLAPGETFMCPEMMHVVIVANNGTKQWNSMKYADVPFPDGISFDPQLHPANQKKKKQEIRAAIQEKKENDLKKNENNDQEGGDEGQ